MALRPYAWRRLDVAAGIAGGWFDLESDPKVVRGHELVADGPDLWMCRFRIELDPHWCTRSAEIEVDEGGGSRRLRVERQGEGWEVNGIPRPDLAGCDDIDVAATPLTNTFPIRRLQLQEGESAEVLVVWVAVPELEVRRATQRYERLPGEGELHRYRYGSLTGASSVLTVDGEGLVVDYEGFARRIRATK
jgi:hypothetical protein